MQLKMLLIHFTFRTLPKNPTDTLNIAQVIPGQVSQNPTVTPMGFFHKQVAKDLGHVAGMTDFFVDTPSISAV